VFVCVRERERERDRDTETQRHRDKERAMENEIWDGEWVVVGGKEGSGKREGLSRSVLPRSKTTGQLLGEVGGGVEVDSELDQNLKRIADLLAGSPCSSENHDALGGHGDGGSSVEKGKGHEGSASFALDGVTDEMGITLIDTDEEDGDGVKHRRASRPVLGRRIQFESVPVKSQLYRGTRELAIRSMERKGKWLTDRDLRKSIEQRGVYRCVECSQQLYSSDKAQPTMYWMAFKVPIPDAVEVAIFTTVTGEDIYEIFCRSCDAFLGRRMDPGRIGKRLDCVNSKALEFINARRLKMAWIRRACFFPRESTTQALSAHPANAKRINRTSTFFGH